MERRQELERRLRLITVHILHLERKGVNAFLEHADRQLLVNELRSHGISDDELDAIERACRQEAAPTLARPTFEALYLDLARGLARRSTCARLQVGCVVASEDFRYVYGLGYNGGAAGQDNACAPDALPGACGHLHAEVNAIINCAAPRREAKVVLVTHLPCPLCAKALVNLGGVVRLAYAEDYRDRAGLDVLRRAGIDVAHAPSLGLAGA